jgi:hypothetical protein
MTLLLKPIGRGNWAGVVVTITGGRVSPVMVKPGDRWPMFGIVWRVCKVLP